MVATSIFQACKTKPAPRLYHHGDVPTDIEVHVIDVAALVNILKPQRDMESYLIRLTLSIHV